MAISDFYDQTVLERIEWVYDAAGALRQVNAVWRYQSSTDPDSVSPFVRARTLASDDSVVTNALGRNIPDTDPRGDAGNVVNRRVIGALAADDGMDGTLV